MNIRHKLSLILFIFSLSPPLIKAQTEQKFSAINPALFKYTENDVAILSPQKYNNGSNIIVPNPTLYPWEALTENGMPNVMKDENGNLSIYMSSFLVYSSVPPSKVGAFVYTNNTSGLDSWNRPNAGLYWYNPQGATADDKITPVYQEGFQPTNIVAVDIESLGIYEDSDNGVDKPIKLIYLPQRESHNSIISCYEMNKSVDSNGIFTGFSNMKQDRQTAQKNFVFHFINGDTHMNFLKQAGNYYFVSRLNAKRSSLKPGETLPLHPDNRARYRRETITKVGDTLKSGNVNFDIALDMSTLQWEPYSMQPFRLPGFESDIWLGLVTMFGTSTDEQVAYRQRTELAISNNGQDWRYLKPGVPFLDNGTDPQSDDHGCINMAKPVLAGRYSSSPFDLLYFYAASNQLHVAGRNSGVSLAIGKSGKWAGLSSDSSTKTFYSNIPESSLPTDNNSLVKMSLYEALRDGATYTPMVLSSVSEDPRGKDISQLENYALVSLYAYDRTKAHGQGLLLASTLGSSAQGTQTISDDYESVGVVNGVNKHTKDLLFNYMKYRSEQEPQKIISLKEDLGSVPIVLSATVKNAVLYGIKFVNGNGHETDMINTTESSSHRGNRYWVFEPQSPTSPCFTEDFSNIGQTVNGFIPTISPKGSIAVQATPVEVAGREQVLLRMYGDESNNIGINYLPNGSFLYRVLLHGTEFASMTISPPEGQSFNNRPIVLTVEALSARERKYGVSTGEDAAVFRVSCPSLQFEKVVQQDILWKWKREYPTPSDSANARANAYAQFSAFIAGMKKITVGAKDDSCSFRFMGNVHKVEIAESLPDSESDFWSSVNGNMEAIRNEEY